MEIVKPRIWVRTTPRCRLQIPCVDDVCLDGVRLLSVYVLWNHQHPVRQMMLSTTPLGQREHGFCKHHARVAKAKTIVPMRADFQALETEIIQEAKGIPLVVIHA